MSARLDTTLDRHGSKLFVAFLAFAVWAFWPSYFARLFQQPNAWFHAHGIALTLWCVLLVVQSQLIRTRRRAWHRRLGTLSYVLAPAVVVITTIFVHQRLSPGFRGSIQLPAMGLHFLALTLLALVAFALFYGLAIYHRRTPALHARWMVCTILPLFTPVTDRLIAIHLRPLIGLMPRIEGTPILPTAGFMLADAMALALAVWDWRANKRLAVFPPALGVLLVYHAGTLTLHGFAPWNAFCVWFLSLPLS